MTEELVWDLGKYVLNKSLKKALDKFADDFITERGPPRKIIPVGNKQLGEGLFIKKMVDGAISGTIVRFMLKTATFPAEVDKAIFDATGRGVEFRILMPLMKDSEQSIKKFSGHNKINIRIFDPGNLRMLLINDQSLLGIKEPDIKNYAGIYIAETTFTDYLANTFDQEWNNSTPYNSNKGK